MADIPSQVSPPYAAAVPPTQDYHGQPPRTEPPRNHKHRKQHSRSLPQNDGTVSDSVTNPLASPRSKKGTKQRQQSVAIGALPHPNNNLAKTNGNNKQRPVSVGGNMLPATPLKEQAYAGPTFQASPAPSSLPVPKFFSKSVPNVANRSLEARLAGEKTPETDDSSPEPEVISPDPRNTNKSPLDIFFQADKAEKERSNSTGTLSPELQAKLAPPATEPRIPSQQSGKGIFLQEMDGDSSDYLSPRTVANNHRYASSERASSTPGIRAQESDAESEREAYAKSLKHLLFNGGNNTPPQSSTPLHPQQTMYSNPRDTAFETPSPFQRSASGPSTPTPTADQHNHYSLHYGNRNLSPLFKAARGDPPSRPSGLRQQELASDAPPNHIFTNNINGQGRQPPVIDPNSFSRAPPNQAARTLPTGFPFLDPPPNISSVPGGQSPSQPGVSLEHTTSAPPPGAGASPRTVGGAPRDIRNMEDDLRRMLNLDVLSN